MSSTFINDFEKQCEAFPKDVLQAYRKEACRKLCLQGVPDKKTEGYRYFPLNAFYQSFSFEGTRQQEKRYDADLTFINGKFVSEKSHLNRLPKQMIVMPIEEAAKQFPHFVGRRMKETIAEEKDSFALLNAALHSGGLFIYVPPGMKLEKPLSIEFFSQKVSMPRVLFFLGADATMQCEMKGLPGDQISAIDCVLDDRAKLKIFDYRQCDGWDLETWRAQLKQKSSLEIYALTEGSCGVRRDYQIDLCGEESFARVHSLGLLQRNDQIDLHTLIRHKAEMTHSDQWVKSVLADQSKASFTGKIYVDPIAQKTRAYQLNNSMILSDHAMSNSQPNLEIYADDVKASHGATITQIDPVQLHYLQTRGLNRDKSRQLLIEGFCRELFYPQFEQERLVNFLNGLKYAG